MKQKITLELEVYRKGDRVHTPEGFAIVQEDEEINEETIVFREVFIKLEEPTSSHPGNGDIFEMSAWMFIPEENIKY
jgi:hypothetical protein